MFSDTELSDQRQSAEEAPDRKRQQAQGKPDLDADDGDLSGFDLQYGENDNDGLSMQRTAGQSEPGRNGWNECSPLLHENALTGYLNMI